LQRSYDSLHTIAVFISRPRESVFMRCAFLFFLSFSLPYFSHFHAQARFIRAYAEFLLATKLANTSNIDNDYHISSFFFLRSIFSSCSSFIFKVTKRKKEKKTNFFPFCFITKSTGTCLLRE